MSINEADFINIIEGGIGSAVFAIIVWILAKPYSYMKLLNKRAVEKEYLQYLHYRDKTNELTNLFLEKIARCLSLAALWVFTMSLYFSPIWRVSAEFKTACMLLLTTIFCGLAIFILSKPINLHYAIVSPAKYELRIRRKLGSLPNEHLSPSPELLPSNVGVDKSGYMRSAPETAERSGQDLTTFKRKERPPKVVRP